MQDSAVHNKELHTMCAAYLDFFSFLCFFSWPPMAAQADPTLASSQKVTQSP
jgi:hypothetical protein